MPEISTQPNGSTSRVDRRAHPRQRIQSLTYVELGGGNGGIVLNVSEGGMTVVAAQPLDADGPIQIALQLPYSRKRIEFKGEIRWMSDSRKEAGLRFLELSSETLSDIRKWMKQEASPDAVVDEVEVAGPVPVLKTSEPEPPKTIPEIPLIVEAEDLKPKPKSKKPVRIFDTKHDAERVEARIEERPPQPIPVQPPPARQQTILAKSEIAAQAGPVETPKVKVTKPERAAPVIEPSLPAERPTQPTVRNGRRTPFSTMTGGLAAGTENISATTSAAPIVPTPNLPAPKVAEPKAASAAAVSSNAILGSPILPTEPPTAMELPRPILASEARGVPGVDDGWKDFRVHLQSGWVVAALIVLLAVISFVSGMAVRRGALGGVLGDGQVSALSSPNAALSGTSTTRTPENPAAPPVTDTSAPKLQAIEVVDSANRRWTIPVVAGGTIPTPDFSKTNTGASASSVAPAPGAKTKTSNAENSNKTADTSAPGHAAPAAVTSPASLDGTPAPIMLSLPEEPIAASGSVAIRAKRMVPVPADASAKNRNLQVGSLVNLVDPTYPPDAVQQGVEGTVKLHAALDANGSVVSLDVLAGPKALQAAALTAVREWRYNPTLLNGKPIETQEEITLVFRLPR